MTGEPNHGNPHSAKKSPKSDQWTTLLEDLDNAPLFRQLVESAPNGMIVIDEHGIIVFANGAMGDILGYAQGDLAGESIDALTVDDYQPKMSTIHDGWSEDTINRLSLRAQHTDGCEVQVDIEIQKLTLDGHKLIVGFVHDRTHDETTEQPTDHYESIAELAGDAYYQLSSDGYFEMVSDSIVKITGYSRDELLGKHISTLLDQETIAREQT